MVGRQWTNKEIRFLQQEFPNLDNSIEKIAKVLKRSYNETKCWEWMGAKDRVGGLNVQKNYVYKCYVSYSWCRSFRFISK